MSTARPEPPGTGLLGTGQPGTGQPGTGQPGTGELARQVLDRTIALCGIPAPPRHEQQRAGVIRDWWSADGLDAVAVDGAGNVRARLRAGDPGRRAVLLCAHLDTVFGPEITHAVVRHGGRLSGPGVGDNTVAVCALGALDALLPGDLRHPVWIVATTGEEGLGNLAGVRALLDDPPGPVRALIALEGNYLGRVNVTGVGSTRWRVTVTGPGGHAWEEAGQPSAVHEAARLITALAGLAQPGSGQPQPGQPQPGQPDPGQPALTQPKTTVNVGLIEGGESVNSRAQRAELLVDLRSGDPAAETPRRWTRCARPPGPCWTTRLCRSPSRCTRSANGPPASWTRTTRWLPWPHRCCGRRGSRPGSPRPAPTPTPPTPAASRR